MAIALRCIAVVCVMAACAALPGASALPSVGVIALEYTAHNVTSLVQIDPFSGAIKNRQPIKEIEHIPHASVVATHSPASAHDPYTQSYIVHDPRHGNRSRIVYNARTLQPAFAGNVVHSLVIALMFSPLNSALVGIERVTVNEYWFGLLDNPSGKLTRWQQLPVPWHPKFGYDHYLNTDTGVAYVIAERFDHPGCAIVTFDVAHPETKPLVVALPGRECLFNLMWVPSPGAGKNATLLSVCAPDLHARHSWYLCIVDPTTGRRDAVSKVFPQPDDFTTGVAFEQGWAFLSGLGGKQYLFNYEAKNVTELPHPAPRRDFFAGGISYTTA